jgi:cell division protein FtsW
MDPKRGQFVSLGCAIAGFGIVMVYSASITSWPTEFERIYVGRQLGALAVGIALAAICGFAPPRFWRWVAPYLMGLTLVLLAAVLLPKIGTRVNGARRWLRFGGFQFQPSELAKIALALFMSRQAEFLGRRSQTELGDSRLGLKDLAKLLAPIVITAGLVLVEPDLGTAIFLILIGAMTLFVAGLPTRYFVLAAGAGLPAAGLIALLRPYQMRRLTDFLAVWSDWSQVPYQLDQSLVSLGSGGVFGMGLGKGWQKLSFLPEANTDFVFAVVGEELGLLGTLGLLGLFGVLYWSGLRALGGIRRDRFAGTAGFVLLTQLVMQALANMAVVTALIPPKGIPLPLVSYGGSALVISLATLGIVCSLSRSGDRLQKPKREELSEDSVSRTAAITQSTGAQVALGVGVMPELGDEHIEPIADLGPTGEGGTLVAQVGHELSD